jgi:hypothetical protein
MRTSLSPWTAALFSSLGLSRLVACGGTVVERSNRAETGGAGGVMMGGAGRATMGGVSERAEYLGTAAAVS